MKNNINDKIAWNWAITYFFIFFSWILLFNKNDPNINNSFVKSHIKSSCLIHLWFILNYIIFIHYSFLSNIWVDIGIHYLSISYIISTIIFLILFLLSILWLYKAHNKEYFLTCEIIKIIEHKNILDINNDKIFNEKDKLTILIAYIPFIWFYNYPKYRNSIIIQNATKINLIVTLILIILNIINYPNLSNLLILFYSIFIVFMWLNIFIKNNTININMKKIPSFNKLNLILKSYFKYLKNYFTKNNEFKNLNIIIQNKIIKEKQLNKKEELRLRSLKKSKIPKYLIYIPFINFIFLFSKNTWEQKHIENWITISILLMIILFLKIFNIINTNLDILFIFPILFWYGYLNTLSYKMPFIYDIYLFFKKIFSIFLFKTKQVNEIRKKEESVSLKIWNTPPQSSSK